MADDHVLPPPLIVFPAMAPPYSRGDYKPPEGETLSHRVAEQWCQQFIEHYPAMANNQPQITSLVEEAIMFERKKARKVAEDVEAVSAFLRESLTYIAQVARLTSCPHIASAVSTALLCADKIQKV